LFNPLFTNINRKSVRVNDCCLASPIQFFRAISWREQVNFQWNDDEVHGENKLIFNEMMMRSSLY